MNAKIYNGNIQPNHKEYKIWVNDEGIIKTWNGTEWVEQSGTGDDNEGSGGGETSKSRWTGHADVEGLKAIGWTDEDIAYYQENGVNWNEEDDQYHKVPEDNIALYGVLTVDNIEDYLDQIVWLPKIDTSGVTDMSYMFYEAMKMEGMPWIDTSNATDFTGCFWGCYLLTCLPPIDTSKSEHMSNVCTACYSLMYVPSIDISKAKDIAAMFSECHSLNSIPTIDVIGRTFDSGYSNLVTECYSLMDFKIKGLAENLDLSYSIPISKASLLYIINNEAATSAITISVNYFIYKVYSKDTDITAALTNHPNIKLASKSI